MRGPPRLAASLALGAAVGCFHDEFLLGAYCLRESDCGADHCCNGHRCRPRAECNRGVDDDGPGLPDAYAPCTADDECLAHGLPRCARWDGAPGFCTDLCFSESNPACEPHPANADPDDPPPRKCVTVDEQSVCALDCSGANPCPPQMRCHTGVCVPAP